MTERQSSGLVKKGKFVRRLLEIMDDGVARNIAAIMNDGKGEIGPSQDYVQINLDKLVASGEVILENGAYRPFSPHAFRKSLQAAPVTEQEAPLAPIVTYQERKTEPFVKPPVMAGNHLARNAAFETFLCCAFVNETPGWEDATNYYCATHNTTWSIVKFDGKIGGERIQFN